MIYNLNNLNSNEIIALKALIIQYIDHTKVEILAEMITDDISKLLN